MKQQWLPELGSRALFGDLEVDAYLNHAAIAPASAPTVHAVNTVLSDYARHGALAFPRWEAQRRELRRDLARLINAKPQEIALGWNTSRGLTDIALSVPWRSGDRVILFEGEFPANVTPWQRAAELFQLELVFSRAEDFRSSLGLERLQDELKRGARLVALSSVQFQTGLRLPVAEVGELCRTHGAELCVDAIQACGVVPVDVEAEHIDYLSCGGHKWLLGVEGAGFCFVRDECARALRPYTAGWLSHEDPVGFLIQGEGLLRYDKPLRRGADVFETGTSAALGLAALGASVPLLLELGVARIHEHVGRYLDRLELGLTERGFQSLRAPEPGRRTGILSVLTPPGVDVVRLAAALRASRIAVGTPDGKLRFSPHYANSLDEVPRVLDALDGALAARNGAPGAF